MTRAPHRLAILVALAVVLIGCASGSKAPSEQDAAAKTFEVPADKSAIYVYREEQYFASMILADVTIDDGKLLGALGPDDDLMAIVEPGEHSVTTRMGGLRPPPPGHTLVKAEPGQAHFVMVVFNQGAFDTSTIQIEVPTESGQGAVSRSTLVSWIR